jgi:hypothetical protein
MISNFSVASRNVSYTPTLWHIRFSIPLKSNPPSSIPEVSMFLPTSFIKLPPISFHHLHLSLCLYNFITRYYSNGLLLSHSPLNSSAFKISMSFKVTKNSLFFFLHSVNRLCTSFSSSLIGSGTYCFFRALICS